MRIKTAIYIVETSYGTLGGIALLGIGASVYSLKGNVLIFAIFFLLALLITAYFVKLNLINLFLKRCKYPYEFLSLLEQLELTQDIQINWTEELVNGPQKSQLVTLQFLADNNLATEVGARKVNIPFAFIVTAISLAGLVFSAKYYSFQDKPVNFLGYFFFFFLGIYLWSKGKRQKGDSEPILIFNEKGLSLNGMLYPWPNIKYWKHKGGGENSSAEIVITYENQINEEENVKTKLNNINIDRIDFMLLLTHFKAKYG